MVDSADDGYWGGSMGIIVGGHRQEEWIHGSICWDGGRGDW